jgi:gas vesicle protein
MRKHLAVFLIGLLTGAVLGLVLGLLFAPVPGANTRKRIADEAQRAADAARGLAERAEHAAEILGERVDHYLGKDEEVAWRKVRELREGMQRYTVAEEA